jgi:hypothetical protein
VSCYFWLHSSVARKEGPTRWTKAQFVLRVSVKCLQLLVRDFG